MEAASPTFAFALIAKDPLRAFLTLGTVVLTITGAEALYADMGHFGRRPISRAWMVVVLPALLLCYAGQAALVLDSPAAIEQAFFLLAPGWALWPMLALGHCGDSDREPIRNHRCLLHHDAGDPARLSPAPQDPPHVRDRAGADLRPGGQRIALRGCDRAGARIPILGRIGRRIRLCGHLDHGADDADHGFRDVSHLAFADDLGGTALRRAVGVRRGPVRRFRHQDP